MDREQDKTPDRFSRKNIGLDLVGLSNEERLEGSILLGGSAKEFVSLDDKLDFGKIDFVVFEWGDPRAIAVFARLLEHDDRTPSEEEVYFPFNASTIIGDEVWSLAVQDKEFTPQLLQNGRGVYELPFGKVIGEKMLEEYLKLPTPRPELVGRVGLRWVAFENGTNIR